jgi:hypothetical protein
MNKLTQLFDTMNKITNAEFSHRNGVPRPKITIELKNIFALFMPAPGGI